MDKTVQQARDNSIVNVTRVQPYFASFDIDPLCCSKHRQLCFQCDHFGFELRNLLPQSGTFECALENKMHQREQGHGDRVSVLLRTRHIKSYPHALVPVCVCVCVLTLASARISVCTSIKRYNSEVPRPSQCHGPTNVPTRQQLALAVGRTELWP